MRTLAVAQFIVEVGDNGVAFNSEAAHPKVGRAPFSIPCHHIFGLNNLVKIVKYVVGSEFPTKSTVVFSINFYIVVSFFFRTMNAYVFCNLPNAQQVFACGWECGLFFLVVAAGAETKDAREQDEGGKKL